MYHTQTDARQTQEMIELKLEKKRRNILGAPLNKQMVLFVDDLNMPKASIHQAENLNLT